MSEPAGGWGLGADRQMDAGRPRRRLVDIVLCGGVAVAAYATAHRALAGHFRVAPGLEDLFATCTGRLGWMPDPARVYALPQWPAFLGGRIEYFPCEAIKGFRLFEIGTSWEVQRYFHLALYTWFRLAGPSVAGFITFQCASYAITSVLAYLVFRLGMGQVVSLACAAAFVGSPSHLSMAGLPLEYAKAPWILGAVLLSGLIVVRNARGQPLAWTALGLGLVAGVGIGFKPDVIALVPFALLTPLLFVRANRRGRWQGLTAALLVAAGVAVGGGTMLYRNFLGPTGSAFPIQVIGGQDWQTESLHATNPLYDYGVTWDDTYVDAMINSYARRVLGETRVLRFYTREMQQASNRLLVELWTTFPGDLVLRVMAAVVRVLWLNGLSPLIALAGFFVVLCRDRRQGWFVLFTTVYLSAGVSLVFQRRHIFHLEVIPWWLAGVVAQAMLLAAMPLRDAWCERDWRGLFQEARARLLTPALGAALSLLVIAVAAWGALIAARQYQQGKVVRVVGHYQEAPRLKRDVAAAPSGAGGVALHIAGLSRRDGDGVEPAPASDYLVVTFRCRASGVVRVRSTYLPPVEDWSNWNRDFSVICSDAGGQSEMFVPIYQPDSLHRFDGLLLSEADAAAVVSVATVQPGPGVTIWPDLLLPADWRARRWFETMKRPPAMPL